MKTLDRLMTALQRRGSKLLSSLMTAALPLAIAACGGGNGVVGKGNGPDYLVVTSSSAVAGATFFDMYECFRSTVRAVLVFKDGSSGDFTTRVVWSSSSPGTVTVSNGDQPAPGGGFYANGVVTPVGGGTAVITANYFGVTASIGVNVGTPQSLTVKRVIQGNAVLPPGLPPDQVQNNGNSLTSTGFSMGAGTTETLTVVAQLNGQEQNVQSLGVNWSFLVPDPGEATVNPSSGVITGLTAGAPLIAVVGFDSCTYTASTQVTVADIDSIVEKPEFVVDPSAVPAVPQQLVVGNTEKVNVYANLNNGAVQDISSQATLTTSDTTVLAFGLSGVSNILNATSEGGPVTISASFTQGGSELLTATDLQISTVLASLEGIRITSLPRPPNDVLSPQPSDIVPPDCTKATTADYDTPPTATIFTGTTIPLQFCVVGSYNDGALLQDVTRQITWTLSDSTLAVISGSTKPQNAGQALAATTQIGTIQVTATPPAASTAGPLMVPLTIVD
ncbi:MAG: beta-propeller repeat protein [Nevskia sp.]|nr:beta-propeller repeat protein [Nevskia sp.]